MMIYLVSILSAALSCALTLMGISVLQSARSSHNAPEKQKRRRSTSHMIALGILTIDAVSTLFVLYLCWLAITTQYDGALPYLTTLIGALQFATGYVLGHYFKKSTAENTAGGITYDAALGNTNEGVG